MQQPSFDARNLHNELPVRLGSITDISHGGHPRIDEPSMKDLVARLTDDLAGSRGFINAFFSRENTRYRRVLETGEGLDTARQIGELAELSKVESPAIPFVSVIALSGGPDSGLTARLCIEAYQKRPPEHKTEMDAIFLLTFDGNFHSSVDVGRGVLFAKYLEEQFEDKVPLRIIQYPYPSEDIVNFLERVVEGFPLMHGRIQNLTEALTNCLISLPSEETGVHCSFDTANLTEFFLDEVTNGATGGTNVSLFNGIPKTVLLEMCKHFNIYDRLISDNSTTWEHKAKSYLPDAKEDDTLRVFHAIDAIHYMAFVQEKTIEEIGSATSYGRRFIANVFARAINHAKRSHTGGQLYMGNQSGLAPRGRAFFKEKYPKELCEPIRKALGVPE